MRITPFVALILPALLAACASELQNPLMGGFFADPGKYEFYSCEQLVPQRAYHESREQKLKLLMDKARESTGGAAISLVAYQGEYTATQEELKVIDATARLKKCSTPANWASTSAIRSGALGNTQLRQRASNSRCCLELIQQRHLLKWAFRSAHTRKS